MSTDTPRSAEQELADLKEKIRSNVTAASAMLGLPYGMSIEDFCEAVSQLSPPSERGPNFNTEDNLHADTVSERYDAAREAQLVGGDLATQRSIHDRAAPSAKKDSELPPAECYVLAIHQSIGGILSPYAAKKIMDRAKELSNGH